MAKKDKKSQLKQKIIESGIFDQAFYLKTYRDVRTWDMTLLDHFLIFGSVENRKPNENFDPQWYSDFYSDIKKSNMNSVEHYVLHGEKENRFINANEYNFKSEPNTPPMKESTISSQSKNYSTITTLDEILALYDEDFVNAAYQLLLKRNPDPEGLQYYLKSIRKGISKIDILGQLRNSSEGQKHPEPFADLDSTIQKYRRTKWPIIGGWFSNVKKENQLKLQAIENKLHIIDDASVRRFNYLVSTIGHLQHDILSIKEKINSANMVSSEDIANVTESKDGLLINDDYETVRQSGLFDFNYYLETYSDVAIAGIDPLEHYLNDGWRENRNPSVEFDTKYYLSKNIDVRELGTNPFVHYIKFGQYETRTCMESMLYNNLNYISNEYCLTKQLPSYVYIAKGKPIDLEYKINESDNIIYFSIVVPVYNTPIGVLEKMIDSVLNQWYPYWQLILVDDKSTHVDIKNILNTLTDSRIQVEFLENNKGISGATNYGLEKVQGDYVVFLDHDDELTHDCLYELFLCIEEENPDYIYSDEDKINQFGDFVEPHFKPDWSPDTMMSTMYVCHVSCVRTKLLKHVGGLRSEYDGCQDWDFVLRVSEVATKICHIPKVLYHWRIIPGSIAADIQAKEYVINATQKVRSDALLRRKIDGVVEPLKNFEGYFRINYLPKNNPFVSIIIPTRDNGKVLQRCIESIEKLSSYNNYEIIIIDNGSVDNFTKIIFDQLQKEDKIKILRHDIPFNYSELNNKGVEISKGDILIFLNDDTEILTIDWIERLAGFAQLDHVGAVGAKLLYPNSNQIQHAGILNLKDGPGHAFLRQDNDSHGYYMRNLLDYNWIAVTGACLVIERKKFNQVGQFDENLPIAYNDIDLCFKLIDAGLYNTVCQGVKLIHHESVSRGIDDLNSEKIVRLLDDKRKLYSKHPSFYQYDPFYNINLHPNGVNFEYTNGNF